MFSRISRTLLALPSQRTLRRLAHTGADVAAQARGHIGRFSWVGAWAPDWRRVLTLRERGLAPSQSVALTGNVGNCWEFVGRILRDSGVLPDATWQQAWAALPNSNRPFLGIGATASQPITATSAPQIGDVVFFCRQAQAGIYHTAICTAYEPPANGQPATLRYVDLNRGDVVAERTVSVTPTEEGCRFGDAYVRFTPVRQVRSAVDRWLDARQRAASAGTPDRQRAEPFPPERPRPAG